MKSHKGYFALHGSLMSLCRAKRMLFLLRNSSPDLELGTGFESSSLNMDEEHV
jgi:hypothetical protein